MDKVVTYNKDKFYINCRYGAFRKEEIVSPLKWWWTRFVWWFIGRKYVVYRNYNVLYEGKQW